MSKIYKLTAPVTWESALNEFLLFRQAQELSQNTLKDNERFVRLFLKHYPNSFPDGLNKAVYEFMRREVAPATYNLRLINLKIFFNWCLQKGIITPGRV
ncbi:MAG: hypothetical protein QM368_02655 [Bacillota bacterium]|nr:hypothetical protein [Bacillota bacterium]